MSLVPDSASQRGAHVLDHDPLERTAGLPSRNIAKHLFHVYIARIHIWWPFLPLPKIRRLFEQVYRDPRQCTDFEKFLVFAIFALASQRCPEDAEYRSLLDINQSVHYFQTSLRLWQSFRDRPQIIHMIHGVLLLSLWMSNSPNASHTSDLWHLSRYTMSLAIEAGIHRNNPLWTFSAEEQETRNRTWWCIYNFERSVRPLSPSPQIEDHFDAYH